MAPHVAHPGPSDPNGRVTAACHRSMLLGNTNVRRLLATYGEVRCGSVGKPGRVRLTCGNADSRDSPSSASRFA